MGNLIMQIFLRHERILCFSASRKGVLKTAYGSYESLPESGSPGTADFQCQYYYLQTGSTDQCQGTEDLKRGGKIPGRLLYRRAVSGSPRCWSTF